MEHLREQVRYLEDSRDHYAGLYEQVPVATCKLDRHGAISDLNGHMANLLGSDRPRLIGAPLVSLIAPQQRRMFLEHLLSRQSASFPVTLELSLRPRRGPLLAVRLCLHLAEGAKPGFIALIQDRARAAAQAWPPAASPTDSTETKARFLALLADELRVPLAPALKALARLSERGDLNTDVRATLSRVQTCVAAQARLIDDLLDVSGSSPGDPPANAEAVDLHSALRNALDLLGPKLRRKRLVLTVELAARRAWAAGDSSRLQRAFCKLIENSLLFTPTGGQIGVRTWNAGAGLVLEITDTGHGINQGSLGRIFEPFDQSGQVNGAAQGLGMGLAVCRAIIEHHGGKVFASSMGEGRGARFVVELPTVNVARRPRRRPRAPEPPARRTRILVVAKDQDTAELLELLLRRSGYMVVVALSMQGALAIDGATFDLLITEVALPDGTGIHLLQRLRERGYVQAVALSGHGGEAARTSQEAGFDAYLERPVNYKELLTLIATLRSAVRPGTAPSRSPGRRSQAVPPPSRAKKAPSRRRWARSGP